MPIPWDRQDYPWSLGLLDYLIVAGMPEPDAIITWPATGLPPPTTRAFARWLSAALAADARRLAATNCPVPLVSSWWKLLALPTSADRNFRPTWLPCEHWLG
jgi:hypothetical protein